jgi:hypothetical protein
MENNTALMFSNYTVTKSEPIKVGAKATYGEYVLTGKRGATYVTYRWNGESKFQFARQHNLTFCALSGNTHLPVEYVAGFAVELTDADRI